MASSSPPLVGIVMGSDSDWPLVHKATDILREFDVPFEVRVISAHRAPEWVSRYAGECESRGLRVIIAAAGGAAHLAGVVAARTVLPVVGIPMPGGALNGLDALLAMVQMPAGVPVGTLAIGKAGAINAALLATSILGLKYPQHRQAYQKFRQQQTARGVANFQPPLKLPAA